jgi:hypothetical protein
MLKVGSRKGQQGAVYSAMARAITTRDGDDCDIQMRASLDNPPLLVAHTKAHQHGDALATAWTRLNESIIKKP